MDWGSHLILHRQLEKSFYLKFNLADDDFFFVFFLACFLHVNVFWFMWQYSCHVTCLLSKVFEVGG